MLLEGKWCMIRSTLYVRRGWHAVFSFVWKPIQANADAFDACGGIMVTSKRAFVDRLEKQRIWDVLPLLSWYDCPLRMRTRYRWLSLVPLLFFACCRQMMQEVRTSMASTRGRSVPDDLKMNFLLFQARIPTPTNSNQHQYRPQPYHCHCHYCTIGRQTKAGASRYQTTEPELNSIYSECSIEVVQKPPQR